MPKKTREQWANNVKLVNKISKSFLKAFPNADPKLKAKFAPIKLSDYRWDAKHQEYIKKGYRYDEATGKEVKIKGKKKRAKK